MMGEVETRCIVYSLVLYIVQSLMEYMTGSNPQFTINGKKRGARAGSANTLAVACYSSVFAPVLVCTRAACCAPLHASPFWVKATLLRVACVDESCQ